MANAGIMGKLESPQDMTEEVGSRNFHTWLGVCMDCLKQWHGAWLPC